MKKERQKKRKHWLVRLLIAFLAILFILCIAPYFLPVSKAAVLPPAAPFANSQFASVDGISLHFRVWEQQTDECLGKVLLIHGLGGSTYSWEQTAEVLSQAGYWVMAADLPGFGYSSRQAGLDHSQKQRATYMWQLLQNVQSQTPEEIQDKAWILAGHSMGAGTVAAMALAEPAATSRLVFVDGALLDQPPGGAATLMHFPPAARWLAVLFESRIISQQNIQSALASAYLTEPTAAQVDGYLQPLRLQGTGNCFIDIVRTSRNESIDALRDAKFPIDAIWGELDTFVPLSQAETLQQMLPSLELYMIANAGHVPMETHTDEFNRILIDMLSH